MEDDVFEHIKKNNLILEFGHRFVPESKRNLLVELINETVAFSDKSDEFKKIADKLVMCPEIGKAHGIFHRALKKKETLPLAWILLNNWPWLDWQKYALLYIEALIKFGDLDELYKPSSIGRLINRGDLCRAFTNASKRDFAGCSQSVMVSFLECNSVWIESHHVAMAVRRWVISNGNPTAVRNYFVNVKHFSERNSAPELRLRLEDWETILWRFAQHDSYHAAISSLGELITPRQYRILHQKIVSRVVKERLMLLAKRIAENV
jgi:hypothetical protein